MFTREQFVKKAIDASLARYPAMATLVKAQDPRVMQQIEAMATMLEMYSAQAEVAQSEPFEKTRDSTVLADAAMRGLVPKSTPSIVSVGLHNKSALPFSVSASRDLIDSAGRMFKAESSLTIPPGETASFRAAQVYSKSVDHIVSGSKPFYAVPIAMADDDSSLCGIVLTDGQGEYEYRERYTNTFAGERIYHIESDERKRVYLRLGQAGVVGTQPLDGDRLSITSHYSMGEVNYELGTLMVFDVMQSPAESEVEMRIDGVIFAGENPPSMETLKQLAKYPSIYNHNAVFLGEFDFLVRRNFPSLKYLSVWNEGVEESVRGADFDSVNALFVACFMDDEPVLFEPGSEKVAPIRATLPTGTQSKIRAKILAADDSYRVHFYTPIKKLLYVDISATVSTSYDEESVRGQIEEVMLDNFGEQAAQQGGGLPLYQQVYQLIKGAVPAMSAGRADLQVKILGDVNSDPRPELWRYMSAESLNISVTSGNVTTPYWGGGM